MNSILAIRGGALGDFLVTVPHLFALQERFGRLVLVTRDRYARLASRIGLGAEYWPLESAGITRRLFGDDALFEGGVVVLAGSEGLTIRGTAFTHKVPPPNGSGGSVFEYYRLGLDPLGVTVSDLPSLKDAFPVRRPAAPLIVLHPGSGSAWKRWGLERFVALAEILMDRHPDHDLKILAGPEDEDWFAHSALAPLRNRIERRDDLVETAEFLAGATLFIGNDSGLTHLSALLGVPTVGIHGPTSPSVWGARGRHVVHVFAGVACSPCTPEAARACPHRSCLESVSVTAVIEAAVGRATGLMRRAA